MIRWRRVRDQIGGRNALSRWSWLVTLPLAIVVGSVYAEPPTLGEVAAWTTVIVVVHGLVGLLMWLAWAVVLPDRERRSRPITALLVFALLGGARGLLMQAAQDSTGIGGSAFAERMGVNVVGTVVVLAAIAVVVDDYRTDVAIRVRLAEATRILEAVRAQEASVLRAADLEVLRSVQESVEAALADAGSDAGQVGRVAREIVRPMSHELADAGPELELAVDAPGDGDLAVRFADAFAAVRAPSPILVAVLIEAAVAGAVVGRFGPGVALVNLVVGGGLIILGAWALRRLLPLPASVPARILVLAAAFALLGAVAASLTSALVEALVAPFPIGILGVMAGTAGAALVVSLGTALPAGRRQRLDAMAAAVRESAAEVEDLRSRVAYRRMQAARFLHGPVQGELLAAALKGDSPEEVRQVIARRFAEYGAAVPTGRAEQQVRDVTAAWSTVLDVTVVADDACWERLDEDPARSELLVDALSEGLTNVVRHSALRTADVRLECRDERLVMNLTSEGLPPSTSRPGIGLSQLQMRGCDLSLVVCDGKTTLMVCL